MNFTAPDLLPLITLDKSYNFYLVIISVFIAVIASYTTFGISERIQASDTKFKQVLWALFGAATMGLGVWSMHFIGSLALQIPIPVSYNLNFIVLSVLPAIFASSVVLWVMNQNTFNYPRLLFCGLLLGSGIGAMHYTGMAAMELNAKMVYLKTMFVLSIVVAVFLATIALSIKYKAAKGGLVKYQFINLKQSLSALVMGLAISGMHYTAMQAVVFIPVAPSGNQMAGVDTVVMSVIISIAVFLVLIVALLVPYLLRFKEMARTLQKNADDLNIAAIAFQTHDAIMVTDDQYNIIRVNSAFTRIIGYTEVEVLGQTPNLLKSGKHDELFYEAFWNTLLEDGEWRGEFWNRRKSGEIFPVRASISAVKNDLNKVTHYVSFFSDITDFKLAEKEIEKLAFYDPLTNLPNRRLLYERLNHELTIARRYQRAGVLFFLDLDLFKNINDSLGHSVGDQILIETAKRLQVLLRDSDTAARLSGDEFVILASAQDGIHTDLKEQAHAVANKIINAIHSPYYIENQELYITTSIGITLYSGIAETVESLLQRADTAMYQAKEAGRNTFSFYQQSMQDAADARMQIERSLRVAIANNELSLHYQPQLSDDNEIIGAEALIRWNHTEEGMIPPDKFIPIAEETGLIISIGEWIIKTVCLQIKQWDKQNVHIPHIAINISAKQFHQPDFVFIVTETLIANELSPDRVWLEITESVFLGALDEVVDKMNVLKQHGFHFSIDDFGTGYSSLTYLKRLPFDQLKIDQTFVSGLVDHPSDVAIVQAIIIMAKGLNLNLIAEGVETDQHLTYLAGLGCHNYQGYLFGKPLQAEQLAEYVLNHYQ